MSGCVPVLYRHLFDNAATFPPGDAPMPAAVREHVALGAGERAAYVGPFVAAGARWSELGRAITGPALDVSLTVPNDPAAVTRLVTAATHDARVHLRSVEIAPGPTPPHTLAAAVPSGVVGYLELPVGDGFPAAAAGARAAGLRVKMRTGGVTAAAFPSETDLAVALADCIRRRIPFKLTAGLHNAVRHRDPVTGFEHHGFLNVLAALSTAVADLDVVQLAAVLAEQHAAAVVARVEAMSLDRAVTVRELFNSFGTCSIDEPLADLTRLGLVESAAGLR